MKGQEYKIVKLLFQVAGAVGPRKNIQEAEAEHQELKKQVETLQQSLLKVETQRDEFSIRVELLEKQLEESQAKETASQVRWIQYTYVLVRI